MAEILVIAALGGAGIYLLAYGLDHGKRSRSKVKDIALNLHTKGIPAHVVHFAAGPGLSPHYQSVTSLLGTRTGKHHPVKHLYHPVHSHVAAQGPTSLAAAVDTVKTVSASALAKVTEKTDYHFRAGRADNVVHQGQVRGSFQNVALIGVPTHHSRVATRAPHAQRRALYPRGAALTRTKS
jgi:hypothetical protein